MDGFTLRPVGSEQDNVCAGQIIGCREDSIFVKITQGFEEILCCHEQEGQFFKLNFFTNRLVYQLLLNALEWMKKHRLYAVLIDNPRYDHVNYSLPSANEHHFSCEFSKLLNLEQKSAVKHIVWGENHAVPILLHGPPGILFYFILLFSILSCHFLTN